ncbi:hypothetical protein EC973_006384 [Apophysomyces ossiformis]|uniref:SPX domain-containing protein n=1 Tax=Apophysomyces ossiformis TaxID=679940 RepID=A0A8H7BVS3_9FUNG|nr:hypothetical protein EC973_006384 [Apophysomyces ossiformis]
MKFAKQLESEAEDIPSEWRPYLIQYKALKKLIANVAEEIERRGLSSAVLRECLGNSNDEGPTGIKYYFTGEVPNVRPCIQFTYDSNQPQIQPLVKRLIHGDEDRPKLTYKWSQNDTDFFTLPDTELPEGTIRRRGSATAALVKELMDLTIHKEEKKNDKEEDDIEDHIPRMRTLVIELEHDDMFFQVLMTELEQAVSLQDKTSQKFENSVQELETEMVKAAAPQQKSDMYTWRQIFSLYMDAQVFQGQLESDRTMRSVQKAKEQMEWFSAQLERLNLASKLKSQASKAAFKRFLTLNTELITIKHYQVLNQTAMRKILKKHDKRSGLTASRSFPRFVGADQFFSPKLATMLCASIMEKLTAIVPQPDDYACPVCMNIAWRPIRLVCGHIFCVRCLIKQQRQNMTNCPMCRHPTAVKTASALNLDVPMQNFLMMYFPKEIKQKKRDNEREQAIEDVQAMTGRVYSEQQLQRMSRQGNGRACIIM